MCTYEKKLMRPLYFFLSKEERDCDVKKKYGGTRCTGWLRDEIRYLGRSSCEFMAEVNIGSSASRLLHSRDPVRWFVLACSHRWERSGCCRARYKAPHTQRLCRSTATIHGCSLSWLSHCVRGFGKVCLWCDGWVLPMVKTVHACNLLGHRCHLQKDLSIEILRRSWDCGTEMALLHSGRCD